MHHQLKNYYVYLTDDDDSIDEICVGNPEFNVNLLHYIDFKIKNGVIEFNLEDIIKVIKHLKYVLFIDFIIIIVISSLFILIIIVVFIIVIVIVLLLLLFYYH